MLPLDREVYRMMKDSTFYLCKEELKRLPFLHEEHNS